MRNWASYSPGYNPASCGVGTEALEYLSDEDVIHGIHSHHGPAYELLDTLMPDWCRRKQQLERILS
jgi:predicted metal-dependent hydrolase